MKFFFEKPVDHKSQFDIVLEDLNNFIGIQPVQSAGVTQQLVASACAESWGYVFVLAQKCICMISAYAEGVKY